MDDDILREVRAIREAFAREFNYDLDAIHRHLVEEQEKMRAEGWRIVDFSRPRTPGSLGSPEPEPIEPRTVSPPFGDQPSPAANPDMSPTLP